MPTRSILLRILFCSLAVAALVGAMGVLFSSNESLWRIAATSIATSGAALLLLPVSSLREKPSQRAASAAGVTFVVVAFLLALLAIWSPLVWHRDWGFWGTFFMFVLCGIPSLVFIRMLSARSTRIAGWVGLAAAGLIFGLSMLEVWTRWSFGRTYGISAGELAGWLVPYSLLAMLCLVGAGVDRRHWRWIGVAAASVAYACIAYAEIHDLRGNAGTLIYITAVAAVIAHANVMLLVPLRPSQAWLRWVTIGAGVMTGLFTCLAAPPEGRYRGDEQYGRLAGAFGIVASCGTLALSVLARINRRGGEVGATPLTDLHDIAIVCPVCRRKQTIPLNRRARCAGCNVQIVVRLEEPRCAACGYSLMMLKAGACPECGAQVPAQSADLAPAISDAAAEAQSALQEPPLRTACRE